MNTVSKFVLTGVAILAIGAGAFALNQGNSSSLDTIQKGTLTIGLEGTYAPFSYREGDKLKGFEVELATKVAKELKLKPKFVETKFDALIAGLDAKKYDVVYNNIGRRAEREKTFTFASDYLYPKTVLIKRMDESNITTLADVKGIRMAQSTASNFGQTAEKAGAKLVGVPGFDEAMNLIMTDRADATLNDLGAYSVWKKAHKNAKTDYNVLDDQSTVPTAPILAKDSTDLAEAITKVQDKLMKDGTIKALSEKYFNMDLTEK